MRVRNLAPYALALLAFANPVHADTCEPLPAGTCTSDAECVQEECGPGEWSVEDFMANEGCVSLTDNGEGDMPECPDQYNGWCAGDEIIPLALSELPETL